MLKKRNELVYKVFGNHERVQLLECLSKHQSVTELLLQCELSQSALSQHLKILKDAGMVTCTRDGKKQIYSVVDKQALIIARMIVNH